MSAAARRPSLSEKVYQHLMASFSSGEVQVGDRLQTRQISAELGVSRTTAIKALERLVEEGYLKMDAGKQPVVVKLPAQLKVVEPAEFQFLNQTDHCYELLLERVLRGDVAPGDLIKERPIALELGINPATVRRAAEWLRNDGLLERIPRRGWRVTLLTLRDLSHAYEIRNLLEPLAVQAAAKRVTDDEIAKWIGESERLIEMGESATVLDRREADYRFHEALANASGNRILAETLKPLVRKVLLVTTVGFRYGRASRSFEEHCEILAALKDRNEKEAVKAVKKHLANAKKFNAEVWERQL